MELSQIFKDQAQALRVLNLQVWQDGRLLTKLDFEGEIRRNQYSVSKSVTSAAIGLAVKEGLLNIDEKVVDVFPAKIPSDPSIYLQALTIRHLMTMTVGQERSLLMGEERLWLQTDDWARYVLTQPFVSAPGSVFQYSNMGPYLAGLLVQQRAGCNLVDYLMPRLFKPLGIHLPTWESDPQGNTFGAGGLFLSVTDLAKFTQLYLQYGEWYGRQILSEEWVRESISKQAENETEGYGYFFWRGPFNTYRADGKYGQLGIAIPDRKAVVSVNSECRNAAELLTLIYQEIIERL